MKCRVRSNDDSSSSSPQKKSAGSKYQKDEPKNAERVAAKANHQDEPGKVSGFHCPVKRDVDFQQQRQDNNFLSFHTTSLLAALRCTHHFDTARLYKGVFEVEHSFSCCFSDENPKKKFSSKFAQSKTLLPFLMHFLRICEEQRDITRTLSVQLYWIEERRNQQFFNEVKLLFFRNLKHWTTGSLP